MSASGRRFAQARVDRGLSIEQVCDRLLLSKRQVLGLEQGDQSPFYGEQFYRQAARKYAALLGVTVDGIDAPAAPPAPRPIVAERVPPPEPTIVRPVFASIAEPVAQVEPTAEPARAGWLSLWNLATAAAVLAVIAGATWPVVRNRIDTELSAPIDWPQAPPLQLALGIPQAVPVALPPDALPIDPGTPTAPTAPAESTAPTAPAAPTQATAVAPPLPQPVTGYGALRVIEPTWIFVRFSDGTVVERTLAGGETFTLATAPVYLAAGRTDVSLAVGGKPVDLAPWILNGQVRMGSKAISAAAITQVSILQ